MTDHHTDPLLDQLAREISVKVIRNLALAPSSTPIPSSSPVTVLHHSELNHPSQERFLFSTDQLGEILEFLSPKACVMEPQKACDHCDICSTRGF
ncbi:MAG TPA: hypothetical protein PLL06_03345 [Acidobacteriota bacterium]|nr:hypothetical protein [Acidobacteriota bacterium]HNG94204.1 hypothetical protein [Acidobacteriota bacterium]HNH81464.1 hypothetical protein [Acidobacteriota bacterium]HNJ40148.1 hypothetical protein [Acidobacteriota bacterium]